MKFIKPREIPLYTLQCEIYHFCRLNNISCCAGYKLPNGDENLVIINNNEIVLIVEFEKRDFEFNKEYIDKSQKKFDQTGVTAIVCNKWADIKFVCDYISQILKIKPKNLQNSKQ